MHCDEYGVIPMELGTEPREDMPSEAAAEHQLTQQTVGDAKRREVG
jgi:hypothetical protein